MSVGDDITPHPLEGQENPTSVVWRAPNGEVIDAFVYRYDVLGRTTDKIRADGTSEHYGYDPLGRLASVEGATGRREFVYDAVGNRTAVEDGSGGRTQYTYDAADRLTSIATPLETTLLDYNRRGDLISRKNNAGITRYLYDARGLLVELDAPDGAATRFAHDPGGLRIGVSDGDSDRRILLDHSEEVAEYDAASGQRLARYDRDPSQVDALLSQSTQSGKDWFLTDAQKSVVDVVNGTGSRLISYSYDAFGARSGTGLATTPWGFTGRRYETGDAFLMYYRAREYDASLGRFASPDPWNYASLAIGGFSVDPRLARLSSMVTRAPEIGSAYTYAANAPTVFADPSGLALTVYLGLSATLAFVGTGGLGVTVSTGGRDGPWSSALGITVGFGIQKGKGFGTVMGLATTPKISVGVDTGLYWGLENACRYDGPFFNPSVDFAVASISLVFTLPDSYPFPSVQAYDAWGGAAPVGFNIGWTASPPIATAVGLFSSVTGLYQAFIATITRSTMFWKVNCDNCE